jgi:hypothetical protein
LALNNSVSPLFFEILGEEVFHERSEENENAWPFKKVGSFIILFVSLAIPFQHPSRWGLSQQTDPGNCRMDCGGFRGSAVSIFGP